MIEKNLHSVDNGSSYWQSVDYRYNIRGWLKSINRANLNNSNIYIQIQNDSISVNEAVKNMNLDTISFEVNIQDDGKGTEILSFVINDSKSLIVYDIDVPDNEREILAGETETYQYFSTRSEDQDIMNVLSLLVGHDYIVGVSDISITQNTELSEIRDVINSRVINAVEAQGISDSIAQQEAAGLVNRFIMDRVGIVYFEEDENDLFGMELLYNEGFAQLGSGGLLNGNISGIKWQVASEMEEIRGYGFSYDPIGRFAKANYAMRSQTGWDETPDRYAVDTIQYDMNGNITRILRNGYTHTNNQINYFGGIDEINIEYFGDGNQIKKVTDNILLSSASNDFRDNGIHYSEEYAYDDNGNMIRDDNKGISEVIYNHMNLPEKIIFDQNNYIEYLYNANGTRLKKTVMINGSSSTTNYHHNYIYNVDGLQQINTEEGRVLHDPVTGDFDHQYFIKDHLGNVRVVFGSPTKHQEKVLEQHHYYPYGMEFMGLEHGTYTLSNKYRFQGKELQDEHNLYWHDFGARMYDNQLGRWHCADPANQFVSPYLSFCCNPINSIDPDGTWALGGNYYNLMYAGRVEMGMHYAEYNDLLDRSYSRGEFALSHSPHQFTWLYSSGGGGGNTCIASGSGFDVASIIASLANSDKLDIYLKYQSKKVKFFGSASSFAGTFRFNGNIENQIAFEVLHNQFEVGLKTVYREDAFTNINEYSSWLSALGVNAGLYLEAQEMARTLDEFCELNGRLIENIIFGGNLSSNLWYYAAEGIDGPIVSKIAKYSKIISKKFVYFDMAYNVMQMTRIENGWCSARRWGNTFFAGCTAFGAPKVKIFGALGSFVWNLGWGIADHY